MTIGPSLRTKILGGFGIVLCLVGVVSAWAFVSLRNLGRASEAILKENYKSILAAENMVGAIERQDSALLLLLLGYREEGERQFGENEGPFLEWLGRAKDNVTVPGEEKIVGAIEKSYTTYLLRASNLRLLGSTNPEGARRSYHEAVLPSFKEVRDACQRLRDVNESAMVRASDRARGISAAARWSGALTTLATIFLGLGFSFFLSNRLVRPLRQMMAAAQRISQGDYEVGIEAPSSDELGLLAREFNGMVRKVKGFRDVDLGRIMAEKAKSDAIIRSIDDGVLVVDAGLRVTSINPRAGQLFGVEPEEALGRHFLEVVRDERLFQLIREAVERGTSPRLEEGRDVLSVDGDGGRSYHHFSILPMVPKGGDMLGVVLVLRDVTRLKELDRLKSEFVMTASHELRTPITSLGMAVDLLIEDASAKLDDSEQKLLLAAQEDVRRLKALVNDLLDLSRIEAGKLELEIVPARVSDLFDRALSSTAVQAGQEGIELTAAASGELPEVSADGAKITWVLVNLISNALRHVGPSGHIRLSATVVAERVHICVEDDGTGIPYEYQSRIFDKFVQLKTGGEGGGSGLGLSICREIVRAHGGSIWVDSTPGEGSRFTFTLPLAQHGRRGE